MSTVENMFEEMLEESAKACKNEATTDDSVTNEEKEEAKKSVKEVLESFLKYIRSEKFNSKVNSMSKQYDLPKKIVKNHFLAGILQKIADVLHLAITITAEIIKHIVEFITAIINKVVDFCYNVCIKLVNVFTLNCGTAM